MPTKTPVTPLAERVLDAETRGKQAQEAGHTVKAERCFQKGSRAVARRATVNAALRAAENI